MNEKIYVDELVEGQHIQSIFLAAGKTRRTTKSGNPFLALKLGDKTGQIDSKVWNEADAIDNRFDSQDFVYVEAEVDSWKGQLQLNIRDLQRVDTQRVTLDDFVPASRWDRRDLFGQLRELVAREVQSPQMLRLFDHLFDRDELMERFCVAPAAKTNHHAYLGGLLEHTLSMSRLAVRIADHYAHYYPGLVNQDLVIAGCVFHDIGKCFELSFGRSFEYTTSGQLVGHIVQGVELLTTTAHEISPALPADMITQLKHLIVSHHGKKEYGSPVRPKTPEGMLLHEIDMIDSRMNMMSDILDDHAAGPDAQSAWTGYQRLFNGRLYAGDGSDGCWSDVRMPADGLPEGPGAASQRPENRSADSSGGSVEESNPNLDLFGK